MLSIKELITTFNTMPEEQRAHAIDVVVRWLGPEGADIVQLDPEGESRLTEKSAEKSASKRRPPSDDVMDTLDKIAAFLKGRDARTIPELAAFLKIDKALVTKALYQGAKLNRTSEVKLTAPRAMPGSRKPATRGYVLFGEPEFARTKPEAKTIEAEVVAEVVAVADEKFEPIAETVKASPTADAVVEEHERVEDALVHDLTPAPTPAPTSKVINLDDL